MWVKGTSAASRPCAMRIRHAPMDFSAWSEMRVVAANTTPFLVCFERRSGGAGVFIAEDQVIVHEVADSLDSRPTK